MPKELALHTDTLRGVTSFLNRAESLLARHMNRDSGGEKRPIAFMITVNGITLTQRDVENGASARLSRAAFNQLLRVVGKTHCPGGSNLLTIWIRSSRHVILQCRCGTTVYDSTNLLLR